jgi:hypothetical protein
MDATIESIVRQWVTTGVLLIDSRPLLQEQYRIEIGAPKGCKPCASNWSDIKQHFWFQFKQLDRQAYLMRKDLRKYLIVGQSFLMLPGESTSIVNDGEDTEDTKVLTDEMAVAILEKYPSYSTLIQINPAWQEAQELIDGVADEATTLATDAADATAKALQLRIDELESHNDELTAENATLKDELAKAKDETRVVKGQLTKAKNELATLKGQPISTGPAIASVDGVTPPADDAALAVNDAGSTPDDTGKVDMSGSGGSSEGNDPSTSTEGTATA